MESLFFCVAVGGTARKWPRLLSTGLIGRCDCRLRNSRKTMVWQSVSFSGEACVEWVSYHPSSASLTANTASPSPTGYHRTPATPTEFCRPLRLAEKVFVCKNCFSFSWEWVIWHAGILFQLSFFFLFFKQRRLNAASFPGYVTTRVPATTSCLRVPSGWSLNSSKQLVKAARSSEFNIIPIYAH